MEDWQKSKKQLIKELNEFRKNIYHLRCIGCGKVISIYCKEKKHKDIKIPKEIKKQLLINTKKIYLIGLCQRCEISKLKQEIANIKSLDLDTLRQNEMKYRTLIENLPQKIFYKDRNSVYVSCNINYAKDLKIKPDEITGKTDYDFYPRELTEKYRADDRRIIKFGKIEEIEERYIKDGKYTIVHTVKTPVRDKKGNIIGVLGIFWDITERKKTEEALRIKDYAIASSINGIAFNDLDGRFVYTNSSFLKMLGCKSDKEVLGKTPVDFGVDKYEVLKAMEILKDTGRWNRELGVKKKDGSILYVQLLANVVKDKTGRPLCMMASFIDITTRKNMEEILRESERKFRTIVENVNDIIFQLSPLGLIQYVSPQIERYFGYRPESIIRRSLRLTTPRNEVSRALEALGQVLSGKEIKNFEINQKDGKGNIVPVEVNAVPVKKDNKVIAVQGVIRDITERKKAEEKLLEAMKIKLEFISMVSHELRTPLTTIKESIAILLDSTDGIINAEQKEFLDIAKRNIDRLARFINDVLDFQKLESGRMKFYMQENDINGVVKEMHKQMISLAREKGLNFYLKLRTKLPKAKFDRDKIIQVLTNIVNNAIKFTEKGNIVITTDRDNKNKAIHVSVKDTGLGIRKEDLPKVFCKFGQLTNTTGKRIDGTGLGLAICKEVIQRHNGKIWVESELGNGTSVHFVLPINR